MLDRDHLTPRATAKAFRRLASCYIPKEGTVMEFDPGAGTYLYNHLPEQVQARMIMYDANPAIVKHVRRNRHGEDIANKIHEGNFLNRQWD